MVLAAAVPPTTALSTIQTDDTVLARCLRSTVVSHLQVYKLCVLAVPAASQELLAEALDSSAAGERPGRRLEVGEEEWAAAFVHWLQALRTRCGYTKVSRRCLVHTRHQDDWGKVYLKGAKLGEGSYGEVFLALHAALGVARVVKSVPKSQLSMAGDLVEDEVNMLKSLDHPHIVRVFEAFESEETFHIVMDYAEGGDLASAIRDTQDAGQRLPEAWAREITSQVASALHYMHTRGVIHCDLKPGNTMLLQPFVLADVTAGLAQPHVLLADFGLAEIFDESGGLGGPVTVKGSPAYLSPEGFEGILTQKSDTWALGVMLYEMLLGQRPFKGTSNVFLLFCQVANTEPPMEDLPLLVRSLVQKLMVKDPKLRLSARECASDEWILAGKKPPPHPEVRNILPATLGHAGYFHRAVMFCIAAGLGMKDMRELFQIFQILDEDLSGLLSREELRVGLIKLGVRQDPAALMAVMDLDQDGYISYTEFLAAALRLEEERGDRLMRYAFSMFDLDGDGYISMQELRQLLSGEGPLADVLPDGHTVEEVMDDVSKGEGRISFARFRSYLANSRNSGDWHARSFVAEVGLESKDSGALNSASSEDVGAKLRSVTFTSLLVDALDDPVVEEETEDSDVSVELGSDKVSSVFRKKKNPMKKATTAVQRQELLGFHHWLEELFQDARQGAPLQRLLIFRDPRVEAAYVAHYLPATCKQTQILGLCLICYSISALLTEGFRWSPTLAKWDRDVYVLYNLAWLLLALCGASLIAACSAWRRRLRRQQNQ
ncbi:unnamed protein product, partial [Polarella glacialis]